MQDPLFRGDRSRGALKCGHSFRISPFGFFVGPVLQFVGNACNRYAKVFEDFVMTRNGWIRRPWTGYALAIVLLALATGLRKALDPVLGDVPPLTITRRSVLAAWYAVGDRVCGDDWRVFLVDYSFIPLRGAFTLGDLDHQVGMVLSAF